MAEVTFNVANSNGRTFSILAQDKDLVKAVVNVKENNTITNADVKLLQSVAAKNGDIGILEQCDLSGQHKLNLAKMNNFDEFYDVKLSDDGKMFKITVKKTGLMTQDPTLDTIKSDFGIADNVIVNKRDIPYGNEDLIRLRSKSGSSGDGRYTDYDNIKLRPGDTINIPVSCIEINGSPRGFFGRWFNQ